jgi:hypothetical protein
MKNLAQISIGLFVVVNTVFELYDCSECVNMSIIYFSGLYLSLVSICLDLFLKYKSIFGAMMGLAFLTRFFWEISKWGMSVSEYLDSVNSYEKSILFAFLTITLTITSIHHVRRTKRNRSYDK